MGLAKAAVEHRDSCRDASAFGLAEPRDLDERLQGFRAVLARQILNGFQFFRPAARIAGLPLYEGHSTPLL